FGTPAYVYAPGDIRTRARRFVAAFAALTDDFEVTYASKAAPITAVLRLLAGEGLSVDVASGGELYLALNSGFEPRRVHVHGNNKTDAELLQAHEAGVGYVVLDSFDEIRRAERLFAGSQQVLVRVTPGGQGETHASISTGQVDSKFGFGIAGGSAAQAIEAVQDADHLTLAGLHAHIGSQLFDLDPYEREIDALAQLASGLELEVLNVGGGLGIAYTAEDRPPAIEEYVSAKVRAVNERFDPVPRIVIEPGRSLVGNAAVTAYTIGTVKEIPGVRTYLSVDGGMSDNLRPMLYGSRYEALIANRAGEPPDTTATVAGLHCESGDVLVRDARLAAPGVGDLLVTPATGAYGFAMANNYNAALRPPVVFCEDGDAELVVRRDSFSDLTARDVAR
ncbi:MAG: diaminopimelate decarboxylase, partial [Solirubrobacterales bacterium]